MPDSNEVNARLAKVLVEALGVDGDEIIPSATLQGDLGAESIDFLDIVFRLEKEFGIKIPRGELFFEPVFQGKADFVQDGHLTAEGLAALRLHMPYADLNNLERDRRPVDVADLFTVDLLCELHHVEARSPQRSRQGSLSTGTRVQPDPSMNRKVGTAEENRLMEAIVVLIFGHQMVIALVRHHRGPGAAAQILGLVCRIQSCSQ